MFETTAIADGVYYLIAVADSGRLSTVVADITVMNSDLAGDAGQALQLPTLPLDAGGHAAPASTQSTSLGDLSLVAPAALAAVGVVGMLVLVGGLVGGLTQRHKTTA